MVRERGRVSEGESEETREDKEDKGTEGKRRGGEGCRREPGLLTERTERGLLCLSM